MKREQLQVHGMEIHYPIMINMEKKKKKKAAAFSKCHFGSFHLTSDHKSLSFTLGCTDVYSQPKKKQFYSVRHCGEIPQINFILNKKKFSSE